MHTHVRMKTIARGPDFSANPGDLIAADHPRAQALLDAGHADPVTIAAGSPAARREKAVAPPHEARAVKPRSSSAKRGSAN